MEAYFRERIVGLAKSSDQEISPEGYFIVPSWAKLVGAFNRDSVDILRRQLCNQLHRTGRCAKNEACRSMLGNSDRPPLHENFAEHWRGIRGWNARQNIGIASLWPVLSDNSVPPVNTTEMAIKQNDRNSRRPLTRARVELHPKVPVMPGDLEAIVAGLGEPRQ
jgi:hypothetical protein